MNTLKCQIEEHGRGFVQHNTVLNDSLRSLGEKMGAVLTSGSLRYVLIVAEVVSKDPRLCGGHPRVVIVVLTACPVAIVGVKPSPCGKIRLIAEAQMPLA